MKKESYYNPLKIRPKTFKLLIVFLLFGFTLFNNAQNSYTFTTAGVSGSVGPTQAQINTAYAGSNLNGNVVINPQGVQNWTVPVSGGYKIEAWGAQGGGVAGGRGAYMSGEFNLTSGQVLKILAGQQGESFSSDRNIGGGGASYIVTSSNTILIIAGGGGAARSTYSTSDGDVLQNGQGGYISATTLEGAGGSNGNGGGGASCRGGGGAGWLSNGLPGNCGAPAGLGGLTFLNGGSGGGTANGAAGGFGGGGSADGTNNAWTYAGGGGGYSGGGGASTGDATPRGGGGGSINTGSNQINVSGNNTGHGRVIITELCSITLSGSGSNSLAPAICAGNSVTLTTNAVSNYSWSNGATTASIIVSPSVTTSYSLTATSASNCLASASITVNVSSGSPVLTINSSTNNVCFGQTATLTASGALTYTWTGAVTNAGSFTPTVTQTYTVLGENGCGISSSATSISVAPLAVNASISSSISCDGNAVTLNATAAATGYTWQPVNLTGSNVIISPTVSTIYTVTASDGTCSGIATVASTVNPNPTINVSASSSIICEGDAVSLNASGGINYTWTPGGLSGPSVTLTPNAPVAVNVTGDNTFGCTSSALQIIIVNPAPIVNVSSNKSVLCPANAATLSVGGNANTYSWNTGSQGASIIVNPLSSSVFSVTGTFSNTGCNNTGTVLITVFNPSFMVSPATALCLGSAITLTASGADSYLWSNGQPFASTSVSPTLSSVYTVTGTTTFTDNITICESTNSVQVTVNPLPSVTAVSTKTNICRGENITLTAGGANTYTWSANANNASTQSVSLIINTIGIVNYSVTGTDNNGCSNMTSILVKVDLCSGLSEALSEEQNIIVYPNPNNGNFTIKAENSVNLILVNSIGQVVRSFELKEGNLNTISVTGLSKGIYFIKANNSTDKTSVQLKIVVD